MILRETRGRITLLAEELQRMPIDDRDYIRGEHPPNCSCAERTTRRLERMRQEALEDGISNRPRFRGSSHGGIGDGGSDRGAPGRRHRLPNWLKALLVIAALSVAGLVLSALVGSLIPFWLLLGVSLFYCVDRWLSYYTWKHKPAGRIYRLILNLSLLSLLGLLVWSGVLLFTQRFMQSPLVGSLVFVFEFIVFVWLCRVVSRNSWRQPGMKLTLFSAVSLLLIFSFAGVQPLTTYKDNLVNSISDYFTDAGQLDTTPSPSDTTPSPSDTTPAPSDTTPSSSDRINSRTGQYGSYYLGLADTPGGVLSGNGCYDDEGEFIVLINNEYAVNPSYSELVSFLRRDNTDQFPYIPTVSIPGFYYGSAESHVDLENVQDIIDGVAQPGDPHVCADFAERLHNNAELAGIRCAYVSVGLAGSTGHACNAFQTTDRGLIYIDCTGISDGYGPDKNDRIVDIQVGQQYNPDYLFPSGGWYIPGGTTGRVTDFQVIWDGTWNG
jgi:hypothetical protein